MTAEEKVVIDAAIDLQRVAGTNPLFFPAEFHVALPRLVEAVENLLRRRAGKRDPWVSENMDGTWNVMDGEDIVAGPIPEKYDADEYLAAMKRGDC